MFNKIEYIKEKIPKWELNKDTLKGLCPFHEDDKASFIYNIEKHYWKCLACGEKGNSFEKFYAKIENLEIEVVNEAFKNLYEDKEVIQLSKADVNNWNELLFKMPELLNHLQVERGWSKEVLQKYLIGYDMNRLTIPVFNKSNKIVNVRFYDIHKKHLSKMINHPDNKSAIFIYPFNILEENETLFLCEGEPDVLAGLSIGLPCITLTGGANSFDRKLLRYFKDKNIFIIYDNDGAGKQGAIKIRNELKKVCTQTAIINLPVKNEKEDLTDWILKYNGNKDILSNMISSADIISKESEYTKLLLKQILYHKYIGQKIETNALVVGKETETYVIPSKIELLCSRTGKYCNVCPFNTEEASEIIFHNKILVELMNTKEERFLSIIRKTENIPCKTFDYTIKEYINLTELQLMPTLESEETGIILYAVSKKYDIEPNFAYTLKGEMIAHPITQLGTFVIDIAEMLQDDISIFELSEKELKDLMSVLHREFYE